MCVFWLGLLSVRRFVLFGAGWSVCVLCVVCLVVFCFLCYGLVWFLCLALVGSGLVWGVGRPSAKETLFSSMASEKISLNYCYNMLLANQTNTKKTPLNPEHQPKQHQSAQNNQLLPLQISKF